MTTNHEVRPDEVMAYLDGELTPDRTQSIAQHLQDCGDCQAISRDLDSVAQQLLAWEIEPMPTDAAVAVAAVRQSISSVEPKRAARTWLAGWRLWATMGTVAAVIAIFAVAFLPRPEVMRQASLAFTPFFDSGAPASGRLITRRLELRLRVRDVARTRDSVEQLMQRYGGYAVQMSVTHDAESQSLTAFLRVPAAELEQAREELEKLGDLSQESQSAEDVTKSYVDTHARLLNAQATERQYLAVLRKATKVGEILAVEKELSSNREVIDTTQAEQNTLELQVKLAAISLTAVQRPEPGRVSFSTQLRKAVTTGARNLSASVGALLLWAANYVPVILFWSLLVFWPARWLWRKRQANARPIA